jgi:hypothetical protein
MDIDLNLDPSATEVVEWHISSPRHAAPQGFRVGIADDFSASACRRRVVQPMVSA